ncbi:hypothetical protein GCM10020001_097170 [Nonomuraea salmonea]
MISHAEVRRAHTPVKAFSMHQSGIGRMSCTCAGGRCWVKGVFGVTTWRQAAVSPSLGVGQAGVLCWTAFVPFLRAGWSEPSVGSDKASCGDGGAAAEAGVVTMLSRAAAQDKTARMDRARIWVHTPCLR